MERLLALQNQEQKEEKLFKETLFLRDQILVFKSTIGETEKQRRSVEKIINDFEPRIYDVETEVKILEKQNEDTRKYITGRVADVLALEGALKKSRASFNNDLRKCIEITKNLRNENDFPQPLFTSENITDQKEEIAENTREMWTLYGEVEAMILYEKFQRKKIEELERIKEVVGKLDLNSESLRDAFDEDMEW